MDDHQKNVGAALQRLRLAAGLSQPALAAKSGVPLGTIRNVEYGRREPLLGTAWKLVKALGVSLDEWAAAYEDAPAKKGRKKP